MPTKKYTKAELEAWVSGWNLPDDKKQAVVAALGDDAVVGHVGESIFMRQDYDRSYNELTQERAAIAQKQNEVLTLETQLTQWREENNPKFETAVAEAAQAKDELTRMTHAYIQHGHSLSELGNGDEPPKPSAAPAAVFDDSKYVSKEDMAKIVPALASFTPQYQAIVQEHFKLTGEYPDGDKILAEVYKGKTARAAWEETHGIAAIREKKNEELVEQRIAAAVKDAETKIRTEMAIDPAARRDQAASNSFGSAIAGALAPDADAMMKADQASRNRAAAALENFDPRL